MSKIYVQPLYHLAAPEYVAFAKEQGYNLEVATFGYTNVYDMDWQEALQEHQRQLLGFKGKVSFHGVFQDVTIHSSDKKIAQTSKERIFGSLQVADALNARQVVFHGNINPLVLNEYYQKNWLDRNITFWQQALDKYEGTILLENVWEPNPEVFRMLLDQVDSPRLKICLDVGHANVYSKVPFEDWIATLDSDISYMHLSDNTGEKDAHMEIGAGKIDWQKLTQTLKRHNLKPEVVLETCMLEKTKNSLAYMQQYGIYPFSET
ncbi:MAG: sugar phosphate isomerase/epimerase [Candidatus Bathyarchaeota archaeon]|nr:sugar phosphate isomerase/epimerase [Candidatus Bathyarchaeota archaeon]